MLQLRYTLSEDVWRRFFEAHYAKDHSLKIRYWYGAAFIVIGAFGLGGLFENRLLAAGLLLAGLYCVLSRHIFALQSIFSIRKSPHFQKEILLRISRDGLLVDGEDFRYRNAWSDFIGYRKVRPGYMFYVDKNAFFFIPQAVLNEEDERQVEQLVEASGLKRLS